MSFGEPSSSSLGGRFLALAKELVHENNITFLAAAGNEGPALSTVSAPGTGEFIMAIGAYVSAPMMKQSYSMREELSETHYTWTSRGPAPNGALGPSVSAPGGAIAPVPNWTHSRNQLMNGTSMASPNACGGAALIVSALKQRHVPYTSHMLRRAIENSSRRVEGAEVFANGHGLIQVERAFESLLSIQPLGLPAAIHYKVRCSQGGAGYGPRGDEQGVYIREPSACGAKRVVSVHVTPEFPRSTTSTEKIGFQVSVALSCTSSWIQVPSHVVLMSGGRKFDIEVNPVDLPPGVHYGEVRGCADDDAVSTAATEPLFRIPVTIIVPTINLASRTIGMLRTEHTCELHFHAGKIIREFIHTPDHATWVDIKAITLQCDTSVNLAVHAVQLRPNTRFDKYQLNRVLALKTGTEKVVSMAIEGNGTLELCLAQWWSSLRSAQIRLEISFRGVVPSPRELTLESGGVKHVTLRSALRPELIEPVAVLNKWQRHLRPVSYDISVQSELRDLLPPDKPTYSMALEYSFEVEAAGMVIPRFSLITGRLYEAQVAAQSYTIFDAKNRVVHQGDCYPEKPKLSKGKYTLSLLLRHDDYSTLESLKTLLLTLEFSLEKDIKCTVYGQYDDAILKGSALSTSRLTPDQPFSVFVAAPAASSIPEVCKLGDVLIGTIYYGKKDDLAAGSGRRPGGFPLSMPVAPTPKKESTDNDASNGDKVDPPKPSLNEAIRDWKVKYLESATAEEYLELSMGLLREHPNNVSVLAAVMRYHNKSDKRMDRLMEVKQACEAVINGVDKDALASHLGKKRIKTPGKKPGPEEVARIKALDDSHALLTEALSTKLKAITDSLYSFSKPPSIYGDQGKNESIDMFQWSEDAEKTYELLQVWADINDKKYALLRFARALGRRQLATAVIIARSASKDLAADSDELALFDKWSLFAFRCLEGWQHWTKYAHNWSLLKAPASKVLL